jgi:hypothetical protein
LMFYGNLHPNLSYAIGISQGVNAENYIGASWIRQGREIRFNVPRSVSFNPQLTYTGFKNLTLSTSGYFGQSGQGKEVEVDGENVRVKAPIRLGTAYAKYEWKNFRFVTVGTYGTLGDTPLLYELTYNNDRGRGEVLGEKVYGYLAEGGVDLMQYIRGNREVKDKKNWFLHKSEMKLPFFVRYERLNTHLQTNAALANELRYENNLNIWTLGFNFNTRENIVFKANYQFRNNKFTNPLIPKESNIIEFGFGFIY